jgi:outer membrane protein assembly factor BamB
VNGDGVWHEDGLVRSFPEEGLPERWRAPVSAGYSGPTVAEGRVYVMDRQIEPEQVERVLCIDAGTGEQLWAHSYPCTYRKVAYPLGPRASVSVADGRAFSMGTMGDFRCLDAATGAVLWEKDLVSEYNVPMITWGLSASPLVVRDRVVVQVGGADGAAVVAFDVATGRELWRAVEDEPSYSSPILTEQAGRPVALCWTQSMISALDPQSGAVHWSEPFQLAERRPKMNCITPSPQDRLVVLATQFDGTQVIELAADQLAARTLWHRTDRSPDVDVSLHIVFGNPVVRDGHIYGFDMDGQLRCLDAYTGEPLWENADVLPRARWTSPHMVVNGDDVWMFTEQGELVLARLSPAGYEEIDRTPIIEPTTELARRRKVAWSHPAFANRCVYARNDRELVCVDLSLSLARHPGE